MKRRSSNGVSGSIKRMIYDTIPYSLFCSINWPLYSLGYSSIYGNLVLCIYDYWCSIIFGDYQGYNATKIIELHLSDKDVK